MAQFDAHEKRIYSIIADKSLSISITTLQKYLDYLKKNITKPCILVGIEDFDWEEPYITGSMKRDKYEELHKINPSYTDEMELIDFEEVDDEDDDIYVKVQRISDEQIFSMALSELEPKDKKSKNYEILDDFAIWIVNYSEGEEIEDILSN